VRKAAGLAGAVLAIAAVAAGVLWCRGTAAPPEPYVLHLRTRIEALREDVERELGAALPRRVAVAAVTRAELGELVAREDRELLRAVDPDLDDPDEEPKGPWTTYGHLGHVDEDGRVLVCREELDGALHDDFVGRLMDLGSPPTPEGPETLDLVLVHELVHVHQMRELDGRDFLAAARDRSDLLARRAVIEGHASAVTAAVAARRGLTAQFERLFALPDEPAFEGAYTLFECRADVVRHLFPYVQGRALVESAVARLGRDEALRRLFEEPPSLAQVERPETWPGPRPRDAGAEAWARELRRWLAADWKDVECEPLPAAAFLTLLDEAPDARASAFDVLGEMQRFSARGSSDQHALRGHLVAAADEAGARTLADAWTEAARARDAYVAPHPRRRSAGVLDATWSDAEIDGTPVRVAVRSYGFSHVVDERSVVVQRGRHVVELRLVDDPGAGAAALRMARGLLALAAEERPARDAKTWQARWRFAWDAGTFAPDLSALLDDTDPDVRHAALTNLLRRGALRDDERERARRDADPLVRLSALLPTAPEEKLRRPDVAAALTDDDPWVVAAACCAATAYGEEAAVSLDEVRRLLRHPDVVVRRAADRLAGIHVVTEPPDVALGLIATAFADEDVAIRARAAGRFSRVPGTTPGLAALIERALADPSPRVRQSALLDLTLRDDAVPGTAVLLVPLLEDPDDADRVAEALAKLGAEALPAVPALRRVAATNDDASLRLTALTSAAAITGDPSELLDLVGELLASDDPAKVRLAAHAAGELGAEAQRHVPALVTQLASQDRLARLACLDALKAIGPSATAALPDVERLATDDDAVVRKAAADAVRAVHGSR
jgi:HEAT repeat protein